MDFQELIRKRYSVRAYKPDGVEEEKLARVLEAARLAPTACNLQPFRIIVIRTEGRKEELRRIYGRDWFTQAPLILAVCALPEESWVRRYDGWNSAEVDATIAMSHIVLAAGRKGSAHAGSPPSTPKLPARSSACPPTSSRQPSRRSATPPTPCRQRSARPSVSSSAATAGDGSLPDSVQDPPALIRKNESPVVLVGNG